MPEEQVKHASLIAAQRAIMEEVTYVQKSTSKGLPYSFLSEPDLIKVIRPAMLKHGIVGPIPVDVRDLRLQEYETKNHAKMQSAIMIRDFLFAHVDSTDQIKVTVLGEGADSGDKALGKAMTHGKKYALREFFLLETGDDPDSVVHERGSPNVNEFRRACATIKQARTLKDLDEKKDLILNASAAGWTESQTDHLTTLIDEHKKAIRRQRAPS